MADDSDWHKATVGVKPLKRAQVRRVHTRHARESVSKLVVESFDDITPPHPAPRVNIDGGELTEPQTLPPTSLNRPRENIQLIADTSTRLAGCAVGVDHKIFKQLSKGEFKFTDRIDLHGLYSADAWMELMRFLHQAATDGHRVVLVITGKGKGYGEKGDMGVIKAQAAKWLTAHPMVLAFHTAIPRDGGTGAVYVLLRKL